MSPGARAGSVRKGGPARGVKPLSSKIDIAAHQGLVKAIVAKRMTKLGIRNRDLRQELHQEGMIGLWRAAERYKPSKGARFPTFAHRYVQGAVGRALKKQGVVRLGEREVRRRLKAGKKVMELGTVEAIDFDPGQRAKAVDPFAQSEAKLRLRSLLKGLPKRDQSIVRAWGGGEMSQAALAKKFKLSKTRVNQILAKAKKKIRAKEAA